MKRALPAVVGLVVLLLLASSWRPIRERLLLRQFENDPIEAARVGLSDDISSDTERRLHETSQDYLRRYNATILGAER